MAFKGRRRVEGPGIILFEIFVFFQNILKLCSNSFGEIRGDILKYALLGSWAWRTPNIANLLKTVEKSIKQAIFNNHNENFGIFKNILNFIEVFAKIYNYALLSLAREHSTSLEFIKNILKSMETYNLRKFSLIVIVDIKKPISIKIKAKLISY